MMQTFAFEREESEGFEIHFFHGEPTIHAMAVGPLNVPLCGTSNFEVYAEEIENVNCSECRLALHDPEVLSDYA